MGVWLADRCRLSGLLDDDELGASAVVANYAMNRERQLTGVNSYARELGFDPVDVSSLRSPIHIGSSASQPNHHRRPYGAVPRRHVSASRAYV